MPRGEEPGTALPDLLRRRWLLVGIGNDLRGDDGFGPLLARGLMARGLPALDAGQAPENATGPIRRAAPEVLILADATDLGEDVGTVRLLRAEDLAAGGTSTHDPSLTMLLAYLEAQLDHPPEVRFLAAQAGSRALGAGPAPAVLDAVARLDALFPSPDRTEPAAQGPAVDAFDRLGRLAQRGRFWDVEFEALSTAEQVFRAVWELSGEVDNGGFDQYFFNSGGDTAFAVVEALEAIGARRTARIAAEAIAVFPGAAPPRNRAERQALLDALVGEDQARLRALDERFYEEPDDLVARLHEFVLRHASEIEGARPPGD